MPTVFTHALAALASRQPVSALGMLPWLALWTARWLWLRRGDEARA